MDYLKLSMNPYLLDKGAYARFAVARRKDRGKKNSMWTTIIRLRKSAEFSVVTATLVSDIFLIAQTCFERLQNT